MQADILQGLYLMLVGMSFVLAFLTLVVISLTLLARLAPNPKENVLATEQENNSVEDSVIRAAISAAVHAYRKRH